MATKAARTTAIHTATILANTTTTIIIIITTTTTTAIKIIETTTNTIRTVGTQMSFMMMIITISIPTVSRKKIISMLTSRLLKIRSSCQRVVVLQHLA